MPLKNRNKRRRLPVNQGGLTPPSAPAPTVPPPTAEPTTTTMGQPLVPGALPMPGDAMQPGMAGGGLPLSPYPTINDVPAAPMPGVPGAINNQNDLNAMIAQIQRSQNLANQANTTRYQQALAQMQSARNNLTGLYGRAGQYIQDIGQTAARDVNLGAERTYGGLEQDLVSRGLGNSTVLSSIARGVEDDRRRAMERVEEQRRVALGGLAERFGGAQFGATGDIAGLIQSRTDQGPDAGAYSQMVRDAAATNTEKVKGFGGTVQNVPSNPYGGGGGGGGGSSGGFSSSFGGGGGGGNMTGASAAGNYMSGGTYTGPHIPSSGKKSFTGNQTGKVSVPSARSPLSDKKKSSGSSGSSGSGSGIASYEAWTASDRKTWHPFRGVIDRGDAWVQRKLKDKRNKAAYQRYVESKKKMGASGGGGGGGGAKQAAIPSAAKASAGSAIGGAVGSMLGPAGGVLGSAIGGVAGGLYDRVRSRSR